MSQRTSSPTPKTNKMIAKGWKKVNKLAHRLRNKGVPNAIVDLIDHMPKLNPLSITSMNF